MIKKQSKPKVASSKGLHGAIFGNKQVKLTPASLGAQKAWQGLSKGVKNDLRKTLKDTDIDGVPNGFDCRPKNKRKQESFLPSDEAYVRSNPEIKLGTYIGEGFNGAVYGVAGNRNMVVKVPLGFVKTGSRTHSERIKMTQYTKKGIERELKFYDDLNLYNDPLFIPTKAVNLGTNDLDNGEYIGLLRPKIAPIIDLTKKTPISTKLRVTDSHIRSLRDNLIRLSKRGIACDDGLQIGFDKAGRVLIYDADGLKVSPHDIADTFERNNGAWFRFLDRLSDTRPNCDTNKYGCIAPSGGLMSTKKSVKTNKLMVGDDEWIF